MDNNEGMVLSSSAKRIQDILINRGEQFKVIELPTCRIYNMKNIFGCKTVLKGNI